MTEPLLTPCIRGDTEPLTEEELRSHTWAVHPELFTVVSKSPTDEEQAVLDAASDLAKARADFSQDVLRGVMGGQKSYDAQHAAQITHGLKVGLAEARYEIATARIRRT